MGMVRLVCALSFVVACGSASEADEGVDGFRTSGAIAFANTKYDVYRLNESGSGFGFGLALEHMYRPNCVGDGKGDGVGNGEIADIAVGYVGIQEAHWIVVNTTRDKKSESTLYRIVDIDDSETPNCEFIWTFPENDFANSLAYTRDGLVAAGVNTRTTETWALRIPLERGGRRAQLFRGHVVVDSRGDGSKVEDARPDGDVEELRFSGARSLYTSLTFSSNASTTFAAMIPRRGTEATQLTAFDPMDPTANAPVNARGLAMTKDCLYAFTSDGEVFCGTPEAIAPDRFAKVAFHFVRVTGAAGKIFEGASGIPPLPNRPTHTPIAIASTPYAIYNAYQDSGGLGFELAFDVEALCGGLMASSAIADVAARKGGDALVYEVLLSSSVDGQSGVYEIDPSNTKAPCVLKYPIPDDGPNYVGLERVGDRLFAIGRQHRNETTGTYLLELGTETAPKFEHVMRGQEELFPAGDLLDLGGGGDEPSFLVSMEGTTEGAELPNATSIAFGAPAFPEGQPNDVFGLARISDGVLALTANGKAYLRANSWDGTLVYAERTIVQYDEHFSFSGAATLPK